MARVGLDLEASALQCITLTLHHRGFADNEWFVNDIWNKSYMNCGNEMKMKKWSSQWTQFMQLGKEAFKNFRTSTGLEPVTSRLPVRCFTNWAMKPLTLGAGQLWVHMFPWKKWVLIIYEITLAPKALLNQGIPGCKPGWTNHTFLVFKPGLPDFTECAKSLVNQGIPGKPGKHGYP